MRCGSKNIKGRCGEIVLSQCVDYELEVPNISSLEGSCNSIEDTTKDIYEILDKNLDTSGINTQCLDLPQDSPIKDILGKVITKVCTDQGGRGVDFDICTVSIEGCGLDLRGLDDPCNTDQTPKTLGALLNAIISRLN